MQGLLFTELYWVGLAIPATMVIVISIQLCFAYVFVNHEYLRKTVIDKRTKLIDQILLGIKSIKFNAWELLMKNKCQDLRNDELRSKKKAMVAYGNMIALNLLNPLAMTFVALILYKLFYANITLAKAYVVFLYVSQISTPMIFLNVALGFMISGQISLDRINKLVALNFEERCRRYYISDSLPSYEFELANNNSRSEGEFNGIRLEVPAGNFNGLGSDEDGSDLEDDLAIQIKGGNFSWEFDRVKKKIELFKLAKDFKEEPKENKDKKAVHPKKKGKRNKNELGRELEPLLFKNFTVEFRKGMFYGIIGSVGAGKSSLFSAILGQMNKISGSLKRTGSIGLISQQDFIANNTLKNNILFGKEYDHEWYNHVLDICQLRPDLEILADGDLTEIGGRGINLSGGQKQRISIARAVYANSDVYLVDDCFSALDAYVGKAILEQVFLGELKGKTIIMSTHQIHFLDRMDEILYMKNGRIACQGSLKKIRSNKKFKDYLAHRVWESEADSSAKRIFNSSEEQEKKLSKQEGLKEEEKKSRRESESEEIPTRPRRSSKLFKEEFIQTGIVNFKVIKFYLKQGNFWDLLLTIVFSILSTCGMYFLQWFIGQWGQQSFNVWSPSKLHLIFSSMLIATATLSIISYLFLSNFCCNVSKKLFEKLIGNILRRPMSFFNTTSSGEIINRCTNDVERIDSKIPESCQVSIPQMVALIMGSLCVLIINPLLIFVVLIIAMIIFWYMRRYLRCSSDLKRLGLASLSPIIYTCSEFFEGKLEIENFNCREQMFSGLKQSHNRQVSAKLHDSYAEFWISLRASIVFLGLMAVVGIALFISKIMK